MAFDKRGYFYRSVRRGKKVDREYYGRGPIADLAAHLLNEVRQKQAKSTQIKKTHSTNLKAADGLLRALDAQLNLVAAASLASAGFWRHERGPWTRRKGV